MANLAQENHGWLQYLKPALLEILIVMILLVIQNQVTHVKEKGFAVLQFYEN